MQLVESSVWVRTLRRKQPLDLESLVPFEQVVTCLPVIQEVLQGIREEVAYRGVKGAMLALPLVEPRLDWTTYERAISLYRAARRSGRTSRSTVDFG